MGTVGAVWGQEAPSPPVPPAAAPMEEEDLLKQLGILAEVLARIKQHHYDQPGTEQLIQGAIRGMLRTLDPYSQFYDAEAYQDLQATTSGKFGGLGMEVGMRDGQLTVIAPIEDTPAYRAGIQSGDRIVQIDGESTAEMSLDDAVKRMRGEPGTQVTLTLLREGMEKPIVLTITRDIITIRSVKFYQLDGVGYIRLSGFMEPTPEGVGEAIQALSAAGVEGLILDLRSNPGGLLSAAVEVVSYFLNEGDLVVYTQGRGERQDYTALPQENRTNLPLVVLVNRGSASASEIVAGALQAHRRALILGTQTFGKASVQKIFPLREGDELAAVKLTVYHYYTPDGRDIHGVGIQPDVELTPRGPLETRMWQRARSSEAMKRFLHDAPEDVLAQLSKLDPDDATHPLRRSYETLVDELEQEGIVLSAELLDYAIARETLNEVDDYEYDPWIRAARQYLAAFATFEQMRRTLQKNTNP